ncbi:hypothetical protein MMC08_004354 [Hypocenomyce scalaris]|nr:hypothetical protein [Hypocenomyce scalaris]
MISRLLPRRAITSSAIRSRPTPQLLAARPLRLQESPLSLPPSSQRRHYAAKTEADAKVEELQELYATAQDEVSNYPSSYQAPNPNHSSQFEIASEETEKKTVYAADDRAAAQEEVAKLKAAFEEALQTSPADVGAEIRNRVGHRVRELERAVEAMEESAMED